jgi:cation diffusion facilitator CzcD-associated flavoprotein CzcO
MSAIDTMVVGAGPYGLSIAAHLRAKGSRFEIIGRAMEMWRASMPKGMLLKSEPFASNLWDPARAYTLEAFFKERGKPYSPIGVPTALSDFLDYTEWFHQKTRLEVQDRKLVHLRKSQGRFELQFQDGGRVFASTVVLATGLKPFCWMPRLLQALPPALLSHAADVSNPEDFAGKEVIVVGAGQSATETAALLHEAGARVRLLVRGDAITWNGLPRRDPSLLERIKQPESGLSAGWRAYVYAEMPRLFSYLPADTRRRIVANGWGPSGSWWLKDRIVGKFPRQGAQGRTGDESRRSGADAFLREHGGGILLRRCHECAHLRSGHALHVRRQACRTDAGPHAGRRQKQQPGAGRASARQRPHPDGRCAGRLAT